MVDVGLKETIDSIVSIGELNIAQWQPTSCELNIELDVEEL